MDMNSILEPFNNLLKSVNNNKNLLILILILLGIYYIYISNSNILDNSIYLFDNEIFKFVVFIIITFIADSSPAIGIALAIIMFASLQIITYMKLKKELADELEDNIIGESEEINKEKFSSMEPVDMSYLSDEYLTNPLEKINQLAPPINFNLKYTTPNELSYQMINKGKNLLNDTYDLEQDLKTRYDIREKQISFETQRDGNELVDSGVNRLQIANQGEYNSKSKKPDKFTKYTELIKKINKINKNNIENTINFTNLNNPLVSSCYNELIYNYNELKNKQTNNSNFDLKLEKVYQSEFELLETIYKLNKFIYSNKKQQEINELVSNIKNLSNNYNKLNYSNELNKLYLLMIENN